ncbi:hypothetical protein GCM10022631_07510 [Deinococcus rubellus]|uniref:DUF4342 domain-containing protein n=1 Tax=Deinococcus rubellus TaxID=1889240 RepID=UPI0031E9BC31
MTSHIRTSIEELEVAGTELVGRIRELTQEGNTRRVTIYAEDGHELLSMPLTFSVVTGGLITLSAPVLAGLGALAALVTRVRLVVTREEDPEAAQAAKNHLAKQLEELDAR